jgi:hypothetical protein
MINITKIQGGFVMNETDYLLEGEAEVLDTTQAHFPTDRGTILLDTSVTIDQQEFSTIQLFISYLYNE